MGEGPVERLHRIGSRVAQGQGPSSVVCREPRFAQRSMDLGQQALGSLLVDRCAGLPPVSLRRVCRVTQQLVVLVSSRIGFQQVPRLVVHLNGESTVGFDEGKRLFGHVFCLSCRREMFAL